VPHLKKSNNTQARFKSWKFPKIYEGKPTKYGWIVQHKNNFKLGKYTDIGSFTYINAESGVVIGNNVQVGSHCSIYSASTIDKTSGKVILEENCKIGSHSVIMPGVKVGKNSLVGAFSFVNKDIPDNTIAFGIPIKSIKKIGRKK